DTRNPPGNEIRAAEYLRSVLETEGISGEIVGPSSDRGTFIARLKGDGSASPLLLMSHTDVVAVEPEKWTHSPFSGDIADGFIYGRGALDMKHMVTMEAMTMLLLKRAAILAKFTPELLPVHFTNTFRGYIAGIAETQPDDIAQALYAVLAHEITADAAIDRLPLDESLKLRMHAMLRNTVTPTILD